MVHGERPGSRHALSSRRGRAARAASRITGGASGDREPSKQEVRRGAVFPVPREALWTRLRARSAFRIVLAMDGLGEMRSRRAGRESSRSVAQNPPDGYRADSPPDGREGEAKRVPYVAAISGKGGAHRQRSSRRAQSAAAAAGGQRAAWPSAEEAQSGGGKAGRDGCAFSVPAG